MNEPENFATTGAEATHAAAGAHQQIVRSSVHESGRYIWMGVAIGASVAINVLCLLAIHYDWVEWRLAQSQRDEFQRKEFNPLAAQVHEMDRTLTALVTKEPRK
jgi:hypothetical protein